LSAAFFSNLLDGESIIAGWLLATMASFFDPTAAFAELCKLVLAALVAPSPDRAIDREVIRDNSTRLYRETWLEHLRVPNAGGSCRHAAVCSTDKGISHANNRGRRAIWRLASLWVDTLPASGPFARRRGFLQTLPSARGHG
jgi:hypothetical protein